MEKVKVKIIKENNDIEVGTIKALPVSSAKRIVGAGFAEYYKEEVKKAPAKKKAPVKKEDSAE